MKTLYQKFAGWIWVGQRHYWLPIVWALLSFLCVCQPVFADVAGHSIIPPLLAQHAVGSWGLLNLIIIAMVVAGAIGILFIVMKAAGVSVPPYIIHVLWIVLAVVVGVVAVKFISTLL